MRLVCGGWILEGDGWGVGGRGPRWCIVGGQSPLRSGRHCRSKL